MLGGAKRLLYLIEKHKVKYLPKIKLILRSASGDIIRGFSPQSLLLKAIPLVNSSPFGVPRARSACRRLGRNRPPIR